MSLTRILVLTSKEFRQLIRDPLSILLGILLPVILLLICGFGMSTDVRRIRLAIVVPEPSALASQIAARFQSNGFFDSVIVRTTREGEEMLRRHEVSACLFLPQDFTRKCQAGNAEVLLTVNASNPSPAFLKQSYVQSVLAGALTEQGASATLPEFVGSLPLDVRGRQWFNEANLSAFTIVPGILVIILTIIGALLTSMVMAREYEHGNLESMFVTPMKSSEILLAKMATNFCLGILGLLTALAMSHFLFHVPMRGSLGILIIGSSAYLVMALCIGLLISSLAKNQFVAVSVTIVTTFLPSYLLSGFLFEIKSMPLILQWVTVFVPGRYYVDFLQTIFLVGNVWPNIFKNVGVLILFSLVLLVLAKIKNPKRL